MMQARKRLHEIETLDDDSAAMFRALSGAKKLQLASSMYSGARRMLMSHLRCEHPDWDEKRIVREATRRLSHGAC